MTEGLVLPLLVGVRRSGSVGGLIVSVATAIIIKIQCM